MPLTRFQRLAIAAAAGVALVADAMWMLNGEPDAKARKKIAVPDAMIAQRFADFRGGTMVGEGADEGDFARAGYIWAMQKRPTDAINCPNHVLAFQRGCIKWLSDIRDVDPDWSGDSAPR